MRKVNVLIVVKEGIDLPKYATELSSGFDVRADLRNIEEIHELNKKFGLTIGDEYEVENGNIVIIPQGRIMIPTGIKVAIPEGFEIQVRPRSGNAIKKGLSVLNSPGTIDADYRGDCNVILNNTSDYDIVIKHGDKIAQFVVVPVVQASFTIVDNLDTTARGEGGFGSTDKPNNASKIIDDIL